MISDQDLLLKVIQPYSSADNYSPLAGKKIVACLTKEQKFTYLLFGPHLSFESRVSELGHLGLGQGHLGLGQGHLGLGQTKVIQYDCYCAQE